MKSDYNAYTDMYLNPDYDVLREETGEDFTTEPDYK